MSPHRLESQLLYLSIFDVTAATPVRMTTTQQLKQTAFEAIDSCRDELHQLSQQIWDTPELGFNEHHAHQVSVGTGCAGFSLETLMFELKCEESTT